MSQCDGNFQPKVKKNKHQLESFFDFLCVNLVFRNPPPQTLASVYINCYSTVCLTQAQSASTVPMFLMTPPFVFTKTKYIQSRIKHLS